MKTKPDLSKGSSHLKADGSIESLVLLGRVKLSRCVNSQMSESHPVYRLCKCYVKTTACVELTSVNRVETLRCDIDAERSKSHTHIRNVLARVNKHRPGHVRKKWR